MQKTFFSMYTTPNFHYWYRHRHNLHLQILFPYLKTLRINSLFPYDILYIQRKISSIPHLKKSNLISPHQQKLIIKLRSNKRRPNPLHPNKKRKNTHNSAYFDLHRTNLPLQATKIPQKAKKPQKLQNFIRFMFRKRHIFHPRHLFHSIRLRPAAKIFCLYDTHYSLFFLQLRLHSLQIQSPQNLHIPQIQKNRLHLL